MFYFKPEFNKVDIEEDTKSLKKIKLPDKAKLSERLAQ